MPDRFERALRAGSAQFAMSTELDQPSNIRSRGERRARRQIIVTVAAVLAVVGSAATAAAATRNSDDPTPPPASTATPTADPTAATTPSSTPSRTDSEPTHRPGTGSSTGKGTGKTSGIEQCPTSAIDNATAAGGGGAGGNGLTTVTVTFKGSEACTLSGYPTLVGTKSATGERVTVPVEHGTFFDTDGKKYAAVVHPGQRVSFDIGTSAVPSESNPQPTTYINIAIRAPHDFEVPINGSVPTQSTIGYHVGRWYLAE